MASGKPTDFVKSLDYPVAWLNDEAFSALNIKEGDGERAVGEAMKQVGLRALYPLATGSRRSARHRAWPKISA